MYLPSVYESLIYTFRWSLLGLPPYVAPLQMVVPGQFVSLQKLY